MGDGNLIGRLPVSESIGEVVDVERPFMKRKAALTFGQAKIEAKAYVGHQGQLDWLIEKATRKSKRCYEFLLAPQILLRLLRAQLMVKFCAPADAILMAIAAVIYFVSPFDLIPDSIPVLVLIDDTP